MGLYESLRLAVSGYTVRDTFTRTQSGGWGPSDTGDVWTCEGGSSSHYSTNGSAGLHSAPDDAVTKRSLMAGPMLDLDARYDVSIPVVSTGDSAQSGFICREDGSNLNFYIFRVLFLTSGLLELRITKRIDGVETVNVINPVGTQGSYTAGTVCHVRCQAQGPSFKMKIWTGADPEPDWQAEGTDYDITTAGRFGFRSSLGSVFGAWAGPDPMVFTYDNVTVVDNGWTVFSPDGG